MRRAASVLLLLSAVAAAVNLFVGKQTTGEGAVAFMSAVLYLIAPFSITRSLIFRREVDLQTYAVTKVRFPEIKPEQEKKLSAFLEQEVPKWDLRPSMDDLKSPPPEKPAAGPPAEAPRQ